MQIQKGLVKYKDRSDIVCTYGTTDDGKTYYFLDGEKLSNGYIIASTALVEAIDPLAVASSIGVIDSEGKEVIPFVNKSIKSITDKILLVEVAHPTAQSVLDAIDLRKDPLAATKLVSTSATIKEKIYSKMGPTGKFVFNDQFSEAMICDLDGKNLMGDEKYSFIGVNDDTIFLSKNIIDSQLDEYALEVKAEIPTSDDNLNIQDALISKDVIDSVMDEKDDTKAEDKKDEEKKEDVITALDEIDSSPIVNTVVPNVIAKENDFETITDNDEDAGDEKSKVDDKESGFSLFDDIDINVHSQFELLENDALDVDKSSNTLHWNINDQNKTFSMNFKFNNSKRY